jgi:hypothetical protein
VSRRLAITLAAAGLAALPTSAHAGITHFGSNLKAPANKTETHPVDSVFWTKKLPYTTKVKAPHRGRIRVVKVKGSVLKRNGVKPQNQIHFQVLHPIGDGRVKVTLTSGSFFMPVGGDRNQVSSFKPIGLCVKQGDYVSFTDVGGYRKGSYPHGAPFRVFSSVPGATTNFFTKSGSIPNGTTFKGTAHTGEELLMRLTLGTGDDAGKCA